MYEVCSLFLLSIEWKVTENWKHVFYYRESLEICRGLKNSQTKNNRNANNTDFKDPQNQLKVCKRT